MKSLLFFLFCSMLMVSGMSAQENIHFTNPGILEILKGNYDPAIYLPPFPI
jgi:hypothetical protein